MDCTLRRHQEIEQNKTKSRAVWPKATPRAAGDSFISHQLAWQKTDCSKHHCTTESMILKNVSTSTVRRRLYEAGLYDRIAVKNHCWGSKIISKGSGEPRHTKTGQQTSRIKSFRLQSSKSLGQIGGFMGSKESVKKQQHPCITTTVKYGGGSVMVFRTFAPGEGQI